MVQLFITKLLPFRSFLGSEKLSKTAMNLIKYAVVLPFDINFKLSCALFSLLTSTYSVASTYFCKDHLQYVFALCYFSFLTCWCLVTSKLFFLGGAFFITTLMALDSCIALMIVWDGVFVLVVFTITGISISALAQSFLKSIWNLQLHQ